MTAVIVQNRSRTTLAVPDSAGAIVTINPGQHGIVRLNGTRNDSEFWSLVARGLISAAPARRAA